MKRLARFLAFSILLLAVAGTSRAQFTTVSGIVKDPTGALYINCTMSANFVPSPTATKIPTLSGSQFQTQYPLSSCDSFAAFSLSLADNLAVSDGHTGGQASQWIFLVNSRDGQTHFSCAMTVTGASQVITSALQACAALLPAQGGGGGAFVVKTIPCASNIVFGMGGLPPITANTAFTVALNCNATSTSVIGQGGGPIQTGAIAQFTLTQNNVGGFSFAWPSNFIDQPAIQGAANSTTNASFWYDGTNWHAQTFPASGGGAANAAGVSGDVQKNNGSGGLAVAKINDTGTTLNMNEPVSVNSNLAVTGTTTGVAATFSGVLTGSSTTVSNAFVSSATNPASSGATRLASGDSHCWRNNANNADVCLSKNPSDNLLWPNSFSIGGTLLTGGGGGTATFPNNAGTLSELNFAETITGVKTYNAGTLLLNPGPGTFASAATAARTWTLPDASGNVALGAPFTSNGILFGNGTSIIQTTAAGGAGTLCFVETNGGVPTFGSCSGSTSTSWSNLSNPSADLSLSMGTNLSLFTHGVMTGTRNALEWTDGASTSTGSLGFFHTGATSTMKPFTATAQGTANGAQMSTAGVLAPIGTGGITANAWTPSLTANQLLFGNGASPSLLSPLVGSLAGTNPVLTLTAGSASAVPLTLNTAASPTGDIFDLQINAVKTSWFDAGAFLHTPQTTYTGSGALTLSGNESSCPSPQAGVDILCIGNSATHTIQSSLNGTTFKDNTQWTNSGPTAHGVALVGVAFPQLTSTSAGTLGQPLCSNGAASDPAFCNLGAVGGGTGNVTNTAHGVMLGEGTSAVAFAGPDATANQPLLSVSASADPVFGALPLGNANSVSGILAVVNGGTGAATLAGAGIVTPTGAITVGHCAQWSASTVIQDSGGTCGGAGGAPPLHTITAATASNTINSTINPQIWNWALTGSTTAFKFGENTAATGASNILLQASTLNTSTAIPFQTDNNGNGWQLSSVGLFQKLGTGNIAVPGTAHGVVLSEGNTSAVVTPATGTAGQVLISNGASADPSFQDPIVSLAFVNIWTAQDVTVTRTSAAIRNPLFSQTGTLQLTWASITGSPATCTLQIQAVDSQSNALNNGSTFAVTPANGTTSQTFTAAAALQTAAQIKAIFACVTYPSAGTLTLDFTPIPNVNVTNSVTVNAGTGQFNVTCTAANCPVNDAQIAGTARSVNNGTADAGTERDALASNNSAIANWGHGATGSAVPTGATMAGAKDTAGNLQAVKSDPQGRIFALPYGDTTTTSYHTSKKFALSSTTDIAVMPGNATNTVLLTRVIFSCTQTTAGIVNVEIIKRSAADTSGTSAAMTVVPDDSNYAAGVSAPLSYTGTGPTVGTAVGDVDNYQLGCNASATAGPNDIYILKPLKPIILRGTAQQLAINLGGAITGGNGTVTFEFMETTTP